MCRRSLPGCGVTTVRISPSCARALGESARVCIGCVLRCRKWDLTLASRGMTGGPSRRAQHRVARNSQVRVASEHAHAGMEAATAVRRPTSSNWLQEGARLPRRSGSDCDLPPEATVRRDPCHHLPRFGTLGGSPGGWRPRRPTGALERQHWAGGLVLDRAGGRDVDRAGRGKTSGLRRLRLRAAQRSSAISGPMTRP